VSRIAQGFNRAIPSIDDAFIAPAQALPCFSADQVQADRLWHSFAAQACDLNALCALSLASLAGSLARVAFLSAFRPAAPLLRSAHAAFSHLASLGAEAGALEGLNHCLLGPPDGMYFDSFFHSLITLSSFRLCGAFPGRSSPLVQQFLQANALVFSQQAAQQLHLLELPQEGFAEQFSQALASNLALSVGSQVQHRFLGGKAKLLERSLHFHGQEIEANPARRLETLSSAAVPEGAPLPALARELHDSLAAQAHYSRRLLELSLDRVIHELCGAEEAMPLECVRPWLEEADRVRQWANRQLPVLVEELQRLEAEGHLRRETTQRLEEGILRDFGEQYHVRKQLQACDAHLAHPLLGEASLLDIRRRLSAVFAFSGFHRDIDWLPTASLPEYFAAEEPELRYSVGKHLLNALHPDLKEADLEAYEAASSGSLQNRHIAFDLDNTLGDTYQWHLAESALTERPEAYDGIDWGYFAHQRRLMRLPYVRMQATLLGLWAAGNTLKLYTRSDNLPETHEAFFNDFPLLKVAFGLASPDRALDPLSPEDLRASPNYMDGSKRREYHQRHFGDDAGAAFAQRLFREAGVRPFKEFADTKIPFPDFNFEVLVDDSHYFAGEMQTLGFGRRWVEARKNGMDLLEALEAYFQAPTPEASPTVRDWLDSASEASRGRDPFLEEVFEPLPSSFHLERAQSFLMEWAAQSGMRSNALQLRARFNHLPGPVASALGHAIRHHPAVAKLLFLNLNLLPADSPLRYDPQILRALTHRADEQLERGSISPLARKLCLKFHQNAGLPPPSEAVIAGWRVHLAGLPVAWTQFLQEPALTPDEFNQIALTLGLNSNLEG